MKIAISTTGDDLDAPLDGRFGRAKNFLIYDTGTGKFYIKNNEQNLNAAQGAGIQAAQNVVNEEVKAVITGHAGPKAFRVLNEAGVLVYGTELPTVQQAIDAYKNGSLKALDNADVEGHWS